MGFGGVTDLPHTPEPHTRSHTHPSLVQFLTHAAFERHAFVVCGGNLGCHIVCAVVMLRNVTTMKFWSHLTCMVA